MTNMLTSTVLTGDDTQCNYVNNKQMGKAVVYVRRIAPASATEVISRGTETGERRLGKHSVVFKSNLAKCMKR